MGRLRIAVINGLPTDGWQGPIHVLEQAVWNLSRSGHEVIAVDGSEIRSTALPPLLTAQNRATPTRHMLASHQAAMQLAEKAPDIVIAPLQGGLAQAVLMARACGEAFTRTRIALWRNLPSRDRLVGEDAPVVDLSLLIADALERQCLAMADAVVVDGEFPLPLGPAESEKPLPCISSRRVPRPPGPPVAAGIHEIVFVGTFQRSSGVPEFIEAVERLEQAELLAGRAITFVGPISDSRYGLSREWLGQRAGRWSFRFRVVPEVNRDAALDYASQPGRLAVALSPVREELESVRTRCPRHVALVARPMVDDDLAPRLVAAISAALQGDAPGDFALESEIDWSGVVDDLLGLPVRARPTVTTSLSVCVLHHDRLALLERALASVPEAIEGRDVEVIVIDNASPLSDIRARIVAAAGNRQGLRVLELKERVPQATAYNLGLSAAKGDVVAFLDDDNFYVRDGLARLAAAASVHDVVVTNLEVFDGHTSSASSGRLLFLGQAHSAGLFYNFFGDTAMAVRRAAFAAEGCFHELSCEYPCLDWVSLAKAHARGLKIGVLQWPAVRYRRDTVRADLQAAKLDQAGARALVFGAYRGHFDFEMVARYAQNLELGDL